jgi:hypothetical protein
MGSGYVSNAAENKTTAPTRTLEWVVWKPKQFEAGELPANGGQFETVTDVSSGAIIMNGELFMVTNTCS